MNTIDQLLGELFVDLHTSGIWEDEKYISDAELTTPIDEVLALYNEEKSGANFDLKSFFEKHFQPAQNPWGPIERALPLDTCHLGSDYRRYAHGRLCPSASARP